MLTNRSGPGYQQRRTQGTGQECVNRLPGSRDRAAAPEAANEDGDQQNHDEGDEERLRDGDAEAAEEQCQEQENYD